MAEAVYGYLGNSTALLADAGHNLSDVLGLVVAWGASIAARRAPNGRFTYGLRASTKGTNLAAIKTFLLARPGVSAIHDLHIWPISTTETALTCHLVMPAAPAMHS